MRYSLERLSLFICILQITSCEHLVNEGTNTMIRPNECINISKDNSFNVVFPEVLHCIDLQLVNDTLLVLNSQGVGADSLLFSVYSTRMFEFLGSFVRKGRGPDEMLSPSIAKTGSDYPYLAVRDNQAEKTYLVNVPLSIDYHNSSYNYCSDMTKSFLDWCPISNHTQLIMHVDDNQLLFSVYDYSGQKTIDYNLYKQLNANKYMTKLSSIITSNTSYATAAIFMVCFPYFTVLSDNGHVQSFYTSSDYKKWRHIIDDSFSSESIQYYSSVTSSSQYIIASYLGCSIGQSFKPGHGCHLHVFDWSGNFLYDFSIQEDILDMTYDSIHKHLYCISQFDEKIIRFDLSNEL